MARTVRLLLAALLLAPGVAAQGVSRLDPHLSWARWAGGRAATPPAPEAGLTALRAGGQVAALVQVAPGGADVLRAAGARVGAVAGDVVSVRLPLDALPTLAADPRLTYLEAAAWMAFPRPLADGGGVAAVAPLEDGPAGVEATGAHRLRARIGDAWEGVTGTGVLVGVFDSGLDLAHPDFLHPDGTTRVLYAWDQEGSGAPIHAGGQVFDYGVECTAAIIDAGSCPLRDNLGHGTHVTGLAAGDGSATGGGAPAWRFPGMAPGAGLLVVRGGDTGADAAALLDGVAWMVARAEELGLPLVVNLSIATQSGPHDGTTLLERGLDALAGPGRLFVTVSGNQGNNANESPPFVRQALHAMGSAPGEHGIVVPAYTAAPGTFNDGAVFELWYDGADALTVEVVSPGGHALRVATGDSAVATTPDGGIFIDNASGGLQAINGDRVALFTVFDLEEASPPTAGRWTVRVTAAGGSAPYHLWMVGSTLGTATELTSLDGGTTNTHLIGTPGGAARVLTVGAFTHRHAWWGPDATWTSYPFQEALGDLAHFSSPGPLREGTVAKPDITAPGKMAVSARGRHATLWNGIPFLLEADGAHAALLGTSMAAPYATGAGALLLQRDPTMDPERFLAVLTATARRDAFTGRTFTDLPGAAAWMFWGAGKLDALAAVRALGHPAGAATVSGRALDAGSFSGRAGSRAAVLAVSVTASPVEPVELVELPLVVNVGQAGGRVLLVRDLDGNGVVDAADPVVGQAPFPDAPGGRVVLPGPVVPAGTEAALLVVVELTEAAPNGTVLEAGALEAPVVQGVLSGALLDTPALATGLGGAVAVLLEEEGAVRLSENPVRGDRLIVSYGVQPRRAAIYTVGGRLVRTLRREGAAAAGRVVWQLDDREGRPVTSGVYLLLLEFPHRTVAEKIFVLRGR